jgi:hypothetical protein
MSAQKPKTGDMEFANAIRPIAVILRDANAALRKAASQGKTSALLDYLAPSDEELGALEREMLRDLLAGELGHRKGRSALKGSEIRFRCDAIEAVKKEIVALKVKGEPKPHQEKAIAIIANRIGRKPHDLRLWLRIPDVLPRKWTNAVKMRP